MLYFTFIIFILIIIIFFYITTKKIFNTLIKRKLRDENKSYKDFVNRGIINHTFYKSLNKEHIEINSIDNLKLSAMLIMNNNKSNKFIILAHGVSIAYIGSLKYLELFYKNDFNVLIIDQRRHGKSEGKYSTYGYFEKHDLNLWINYLVNRFGSDIVLGLHGESMGAGTVMQAIPLNHNIRFVIEDCGYSDLYELMKYLIKKDYPKILQYPLYSSLSLANILFKIKAKFNMKDVSPIEIIKTTNIPVMFIHGNNDTFVPWYMCNDLYNAKKYGLKEKLLVNNAAHGKSIEVNKQLYEEQVLKFIHKALKTYPQPSE